ncbi:SH3 domain-containing protein, partial [Anaeromyxobacter terrae]|uniref:SH3 domain-containing protein n=1 Tax=Anaeromyxobacter terrae TaxID=2925406 RepID=UPI001F5A96C3
MSRIFARAAVVGLALVAVTGCRSAFAPDPVARLSAAPQTQLSATVKREVALRTGPDKLAHVVEQLPAGASVTASDRAVRGFRRVRTGAGRTGYVDDAAIEVGAAVASPAPAAQPAPAAEPAAAP